MSDSTQTPTCPQCGEENPAEAGMCWACDSPLDVEPGSLTKRETYLMREDELGNCHPVPPRTWRDNLPRHLEAALFLALFSAGWWRGKARFAVLGAVAAGFTSKNWWVKHQERKRAPEPPRQNDTGRVADSILRHSLAAGATATRIARSDEKRIDIEFQLEGEWHLHATLPDPASQGGWLNELQAEFSERVRQNTVQITPFGVLWGLNTSSQIDYRRKVPLSPAEASARFALRIWNEPPRGEITLTRV